MKGTKILIFFLIMLLASCMSPTNKFARKALEYGFDSQEISSDIFVHRIYFNKFVMDGVDSTRLHVYLDGDGTPWLRNKWIAVDPTARNPLILRLMHLDKTPATLLGRPCYYGLNKGINCENKYWTSHRYSSVVVNSMVSVLNAFLKKNNYKELVFIGFSGGGTLAVLMANNISITTKVVTVGANLDVTAWSEFHGYRALNNSLNPAKEAVLNEDIQQFHFAGKDDKVVPAFIIKKYALSQKNSSYFEISGKSHVCCWEMEWPKILDIIDE